MKKLALIAVSSLMVLTGCTPGEAKGLPMTREEAVQKVRTFGQNTGYLITYDLASGDEGKFEVVTGMKGDVCWTTRNDSDGIALQHQDDLYHLFFLDDGTYGYEGSYDKDVYVTWYTTANVMFQAYDIAATYQKGEEVTILDRACTYYSFQFTVLESYTYDYVAAMDNELGIALEIKCKSANAEQGDQITFTAKSFLTGEDVLPPKLPPVDNPIIINDGEPDLTTIEFPNGVHVDVTQKGGLSGFIEILDDQMLVQADDISYRYFVDKTADGVRIYEKYLDGELGWQDWNDEYDAKNFNDALAALAGRVGSYFRDMFDVTILGKANKLGNEIVNGHRATVYKTTDAKVYLSNEYKMFLKFDYDTSDTWDFEVTALSTCVELTDTAIFQ